MPPASRGVPVPLEGCYALAGAPPVAPRRASGAVGRAEELPQPQPPLQQSQRGSAQPPSGSSPARRTQNGTAATRVPPSPVGDKAALAVTALLRRRSSPGKGSFPPPRPSSAGPAASPPPRSPHAPHSGDPGTPSRDTQVALHGVILSLHGPPLGVCTTPLDTVGCQDSLCASRASCTCVSSTSFLGESSLGKKARAPRQTHSSVEHEAPRPQDLHRHRHSRQRQPRSTSVSSLRELSSSTLEARHPVRCRSLASTPSQPRPATVTASAAARPPATAHLTATSGVSCSPCCGGAPLSLERAVFTVTRYSPTELESAHPALAELASSERGSRAFLASPSSDCVAPSEAISTRTPLTMGPCPSRAELSDSVLSASLPPAANASTSPGPPCPSLLIAPTPTPTAFTTPKASSRTATAVEAVEEADRLP
eukprot:RCo052958